jgi:hypothetical protein
MGNGILLLIAGVPTIMSVISEVIVMNKGVIVVSIVTTIRVRRTRDKKCLTVTYSPNLPRGTPSLLYSGYAEVFPDPKGIGVLLITMLIIDGFNLHSDL